MATTKVKALLILAVAFLEAGVIGETQETPRPDGNQGRAKQLWELAIEAKGGRERLYSVRNLLTSYGGTKFPWVFLSVFPSKRWDWVQGRPPLRLSVTMCNGDLNHWYSIDGEDQIARKHELPCPSDLIDEQLMMLMETPWVRPVPYDAREESFNGKPVDAVFVSVRGWERSYLLDKVTHLPVAFRLHAQLRDYVHVVELAGHENIGGIQVPTLRRDSPTSPFFKLKIEVNVDYDERVFLYPPSIEAGPDAWRPKRKPQN